LSPQANGLLPAKSNIGGLVSARVSFGSWPCKNPLPPLGTPNARWWPDRLNLSHTVREFEAESVSYLVSTRLGLDTASDEYLAGYVGQCPSTPPISLDRIMKAVWLLEQMGRASLELQKTRELAICNRESPNDAQRGRQSAEPLPSLLEATRFRWSRRRGWRHSLDRSRPPRLHRRACARSASASGDGDIAHRAYAAERERHQLDSRRRGHAGGRCAALQRRRGRASEAASAHRLDRDYRTGRRAAANSAMAF
jgi:hypothetical protein